MALEIADEIAGDLRLDLILLDIFMPAGLDGIETCRRLKSRPNMRNTPVIFLTGKDDRETMMRAFEAGGADYVLKPFNADVLLARVRTHSRLGRLSSDLEAALAESTRELRDANAQLRRLAMEISLVEERERKRLAGELHDSPMQKLALAQAQVVSASRRRDEESERQLEVGLELMRDALQELRSLQFELSPPVLYQEGLGPALEWLAAHAARRFGVELSCAGAAPSQIHQDLAVVLFQCARELVHNLIKHSGASRGRIEIGVRSGEVLLSVTDDGKGFPAEPRRAQAQVPAKGGYGLFSVRERLALLGGRMSITADSGGTRVAVCVPLKVGAGTDAASRRPGSTTKNLN